MDTHLLIKIIHMSSVAVALVIFVARALTLFVGTQNNQPNPKGRIAFVAIQHLAFTVLTISGIILLIMNDFKVQPWFYAKIVLFLVLLSSLIKVYKKDDTILLTQRRAGLVISAVAFIAIISLVMIKPIFG
ncbi:SirB2 family protein [Acinetobacter silvestris]|uniref:Invasion protein expression up-regulator SirB n=1 Tax=Acinetobacter silvestris TaxID=1977882 RepID=A0A1Y3CCM4_9GAMM|nr:SirB2 family protein [Acinetobacter silvestris]OTG63855.1 invasion protein expression up-regulator SirB [Acinetobacter silvestris]